MEKFSKKWWAEWFKLASIRALHTFCQTLLGLVTASGTELLKLNWKEILITCLITALYSYAKSFVIGVPEMELNNYKVKEIK